MCEGKYWQDEVLCNNAGLEDNEEIWVTLGGKCIYIWELTDEHLINIVKMINVNHAEDDIIQYANLVEELRIRKIDVSTIFVQGKIEAIKEVRKILENQEMQGKGE